MQTRGCAQLVDADRPCRLQHDIRRFNFCEIGGDRVEDQAFVRCRDPCRLKIDGPSGGIDAVDWQVANGLDVDIVFRPRRERAIPENLDRQLRPELRQVRRLLRIVNRANGALPGFKYDIGAPNIEPIAAITRPCRLDRALRAQTQVRT